MVMLWMDDIRPEPPGWVRALSVRQAIEVMEAGAVTHVSLDHDLGVWASEGGDGAKFTDWMAEFDSWPSEGLRVHSSNPSGVQTMLATVDRYGPFRPGSRFAPTRGSEPAGGWPPSDTYV